MSERVEMVAEVRRLVDLPLAEQGEIGRGRDRPSNGSSKAGNIADYTRRRLRRDRPDLYERVVEGELSANAAACVRVPVRTGSFGNSSFPRARASELPIEPVLAGTEATST